MDSVLAFFNHGWVGSLLGVAGLLFGAYQIFRHTGAKLTYQYLGQQLIGGEGLLPESVVVQYEGESVERLSLTQIIVWNSGQTSVRGEDVVAKDPIRFCFGDDTRILKVEIEKTTRRSNDSSVVADAGEGCFVYAFGFLDKNDGALIRVLHTGRQTKPTCRGTIIDVPKGVQPLGRIPARMQKQQLMEAAGQSFFARVMVYAMYRNQRLAVAALMIAGFFAVAIALSPTAGALVGVPPLHSPLNFMVGFAGGLYGLIGLLFLWINRHRFPDSLYPDETSDENGKAELHVASAEGA